ncbi:MAG: zinc ribbon domain-containing protein [Oscillospiraceae bacterium]|nr:zinc ribbon domain-containing protein [Oscillospiraceae bacterium]
MALIQCKHCGKNVSDKAKNCPHCNELLIEKTEAVILCEECNTEIPTGATTCPNCGCPVSKKEEVAAQKVEVTSVNLQMKRSTKKFILFGIIAAVLIAVGVLIFSLISSSNQKKAAEDYINKVETVAYEMLDGAADAESAGNLIKSVWYNSIHEEYDSKTDKYTRPNGYFLDDFNEALGNLFADTTFMAQIIDIESNQELVAGLMKDLKNPPEEHQEAYEALKEYYDAYIELTNLAINPTGSLTTFSAAFNEADTETVNCYNSMKLYFED